MYSDIEVQADVGNDLSRGCASLVKASLPNNREEPFRRPTPIPPGYSGPCLDHSLQRFLRVSGKQQKWFSPLTPILGFPGSAYTRRTVLDTFKELLDRFVAPYQILTKTYLKEIITVPSCFDF